MIAVPADSPIHHLNELGGKRVSFPSSDAFAAYAVPLVALKRAGVQVEEVFGGNQEGTLAQLKAKRVEAAAVNSRFLAQYAEREQRGVPRDLRLGRIPGPRGYRASPRARRHRRAGAARAARHGHRSGRGLRS